MSHIFEALQRAEAERSGNSLNVPASATELLEKTIVEDRSLAEGISPQQPSSVSERIDPETLSAAPVLLPAPASDARLVCLTDQGSMAAENFRVLGLRLRNLREKRKLARIVVTSTIPEEGKSLTAANLALNQSRSKILKTLLIDGDLRRPALADRFGLSRSLPGLAECLRGQRRLAEVIYKLYGTNLWFLPSGAPPENPLELMQSGRLVELLDRLGKSFDWIIIDSPPLIPLADTTFWTKLADGTLLVLREGVSEKKALQRTLEALDCSTLIGVIVNGCRNGDHHHYYQYYKARSAKTGDSRAIENE